ncbi:DUF4394 domain-containing protein [Hymenobacter qilianensis]|uniref:DUF4394 domain-containing protein n=1 Tax=Hymenobacter qilianensis TaxID=1385715 RepID=A0A7H0GUC3_9BACT|nr:DUF4394 domain-containing protein [Hymenobacter qilianensis]
MVAFDFNPTVDRIRLVTSTGQNLRLHPETGTVAATDGAINGAAGAMITGAAYTNNVAGAETTALYAINPQSQQLYLVNPPNDGTVTPVGALNLNVAGDGGFDIDAKTGTALGLYSVQGKPTLFTVNLATGAARSLAQYAASLNYSGLAIPTRPVAYAVGSITIGGRSTSNVLHIFDPTDTSDPAARVTKSFLGLARNEAVLGMDFRPATGQLYALVLGNGGPFVDGSDFPASTRLYTINSATAEATRVADISIPLDFGVFGLTHAFDFNPVTDEIRIVSPTGQNLRVNPTTGAATVESLINLASTTVRAIAYTNSLVPAPSTSLYALGSETSTTARKLYLLNPPNSGTLSEVGTLDVSGFPIAFPTATVQMVTFDIAGTTNTAYGIASLGTTTDYGIARINLATGSTTLARQLTVNGGPSITALAVGLGF